MISRYFDHRMNPMEEQNFLISLAASNEMRLAFRSHLELMKAIREDKNDLRNVAQVRTRTLTALGLSAAAVGTYIEQGLVHSTIKSEPKTAETNAPQSSLGFSGRLRRFIGTRSFALSGGLMLGFIGTFGAMHLSSNDPTAPAHLAPQTITIPAATAPENNVISPESQSFETITPRVALDKKSVKAVSTPTPSHAQSATDAATTPIVSSTVAGKMVVNKATIKKINDSAGAK